MRHRVRVGFFLTILLGAMWASAGLFAPTDTEFLTGTLVAMVGLIGLGATDWIDR
jgi:hypothetical protein